MSSSFEDLQVKYYEFIQYNINPNNTNKATVKPIPAIIPVMASSLKPMPSGRGKPKAFPRYDKPTIPMVFPTSRLIKITQVIGPTDENITPALAKAKKNKPKSTKSFNECSKLLSGL